MFLDDNAVSFQGTCGISPIEAFHLLQHGLVTIYLPDAEGGKQGADSNVCVRRSKVYLKPEQLQE